MPAPTPLPRWLAAVASALFALATAWLLAQQLAQPVDPTNQALKIPGSQAAKDLAALQEIVGSDHSVLLAFAVKGDLALLPGEREQVAAATAALAQDPAVRALRTLPSPDPGLALCAAELRDPDAAAAAPALVAAARAATPPTLQLLATGLPLLEGALAVRVAAERHAIVPVIALSLLGMAWLVYRRLVLALCLLVPALCGIAWCGGLVAWRGHALDPVAALLEPVLLTIGVASSVHFVGSWQRQRAAGATAAAAARAAAAEQRVPATLATGSTMLGLLALLPAPTPAVAAFGIRAAFGIALVHLFTFLLLPLLLGRVGGEPRPPQPTTGGGWAAWLVRLQRGRSAWLAGIAAVTALGAAALPQLRADNDPVAMLPASDPVRIDHDQLVARLGGVERFHLLVPAGSPASEPGRLLPLVASLAADPGIAGFGGPVVRSAGGDLAVPLRLRPGGSHARSELFDRITTAAEARGLDGVVPAGTAVQIARDSAALLQALLRSLLGTLLLLGVVMAVGLRSWRLGLLGLLPNALPCLWLYGGLAWLDHEVSVATAMIGCTMLGLIVDNTLHLLHHYRRQRTGSGRAAATAAALGHCGRPMLLGALLLATGFGIAGASELRTTVEFAGLAVTTIAMALVGDAVLLPLLLAGPLPAEPTSQP